MTAERTPDARVELTELIDDLAHDLAKALGQPEAAVRLAHGLPPLGDPDGPKVAHSGSGPAHTRRLRQATHDEPSTTTQGSVR